MKTTFLWRAATALMVAVMSVGLLSCSGDDSDDPEPPVTLVGTWTYSLDDGFCTLTFNQNGTGVYSEYDNGRWEESGENFRYTYSDGVITFIYDDDVETARVVSLTSTTLVLKDFPDRGNCTFTKGEQKTVPTPTLVGTWKYTFSSGYVLLTFNKNGTVIYQEYSHGRWEEQGETMTYTYDSKSGELSFYSYGKTRPETTTVVSLTLTTLVLKDWPDSGNCTFYKQ